MQQLEIFKGTGGPNGAPVYEALSSIWEGGDPELLERIFSFYPTIPPEPILDATHNAGRFWAGSKRNVWSMDIDPAFNPHIVADNRIMVGLNTRTGKDGYRIPSNKFGTVVYDPPHVGPQGRDKSVKRFDADYGAHVACGKEHGWTLSYLYPPFLQQAKRVLKLDGLLLAKISDMVNSHRSRWAHCDFMRMAEDAGFTVCDLIIKVRKGPMQSNRWKKAHHARKRHCFRIICRNGTSCERKLLPEVLRRDAPIRETNIFRQPQRLSRTSPRTHATGIFTPMETPPHPVL